MSDPIDLDVLALTKHNGLLDLLEALIPEPVAASDKGTMSRHKASSSPPWHSEAAAVLYTIHAGARELEQNLRHRIGLDRHPTVDKHGRRASRGGSARNTRDALTAIPDLARAAGRDVERDAAAQLAYWVRSAQRLADIGQRSPQRLLAAPCPECGQQSLSVAEDISTDVVCTTQGCVDSEGRRMRWPRSQWVFLLEQIVNKDREAS